MAHLTKQYVQQLYETFGELRVLDDIIRYRAADNPPAPILGYPRIADTVNEYENFTGQQLDRFVDGAVKYFIDSGLKPVRPSHVFSQESSKRGLTSIPRMQERLLAFLLHPTSTSL